MTCPQGVTSTLWCPRVQQGKRQAIVVRFAAAGCQACPARAQCTTSRTGRQLFLRPREIHEAVAAAKAGQTSQHWKQRYNIRAGVEGTMRQATHVTGIRTARYIGLDKTSLEHAAAAAAVNLLRLDAWWTGKPLDRTRTTHLQRSTSAAPPEPNKPTGSGLPRRLSHAVTAAACCLVRRCSPVGDCVPGSWLAVFAMPAIACRLAAPVHRPPGAERLA